MAHENKNVEGQRQSIAFEQIDKISNPSGWAEDSSRVNFNASNVSSDVGNWGDETKNKQSKPLSSKNNNEEEEINIVISNLPEVKLHTSKEQKIEAENYRENQNQLPGQEGSDS